MKGKARKNKGNGDFFPTYHEVTKEFIKLLNLPESTIMLEPCAGAGDIMKVAKDFGYKIYGCDKFPRSDYIKKVDWLDSRQREYFIKDKSLDIIFTNPPYDIYTDFLKACFDTEIEHHYFLQPLDYLHSIHRHENLFGNGYNGVYLTDVWVLVRRPRFSTDFDPAGKVPTGSITFAWFKYTRLDKKPDFWKGHHIDNRYAMGTPSQSSDKYKEVSFFNEF